MRKCALSAMNDVFAAIAASKTLYLPVDGTDGNAVYTKWSQGAEWSEQLNTVRSPKDFFFPQTENLMEFKTEGTLAVITCLALLNLDAMVPSFKLRLGVLAVLVPLFYWVMGPALMALVIGVSLEMSEAANPQ